MGWVDSLDSVLTQARVTRKCRRRAWKFEKSVRVGHVYWSIEDCKQPWGDEPMVQKWVFKKSRLGHLHCGPHSPAFVWLNFGPLYVEDPAPHMKRLMGDDSEPEHVPHIKLQRMKKALERLAA